MDSSRNPSAPNTENRATKLAGRDEALNLVRVSCGRATAGRSTRSIMLLGFKGTEKSRLLDEIGRVAQEEGLFISNVRP